jgi:ankyrin repeat protein
MRTDIQRVTLALFSLITLSGTHDISWTPLHKAVRIGDAKAVRQIIEFHYGGLNARGPGGMTPLMLAASTRPAMIEPLLDPTNIVFEGVDVALVDDEGRDALILAVRAGNYASAAKLVADHSAGVKQVDRTGRSAFDYAVQQDRFTASDRDRLHFLEQAMWNAPAFHGWGNDGTRRPPTMSEIAHDLCAKKLTGWDLRAFLAMVLAKVRDKTTLEGKREVILCAARSGIDLLPLGSAQALGLHQEVVDDRGYTPRMIRLLESGNPLPPKVDLSADIFDATRRGLDEAAMALLARNQAKRPRELGAALLSAAKQGQAALVERLLAAGAPVDSVAEPGRYEDTPLVVAAIKGCRGCVAALLAANASLYPGSHPSEERLLQLATDDVRPLIEAAMHARRPDASRLAEEERAVATAAFAALLENHDRARGVFLNVRNVQHAKVDPAVPGMVPSINLEGFLWTSPTKVRTFARTTEVDTRPHQDQWMGYGSGAEVILERRDGRWIVLNVRRPAWVE